MNLQPGANSFGAAIGRGSTSTVAIIGGGPAGLTAAYELHKHSSLVLGPVFAMFKMTTLLTPGDLKDLAGKSSWNVGKTGISSTASFPGSFWQRYWVTRRGTKCTD